MSEILKKTFDVAPVFDDKRYEMMLQSVEDVMPAVRATQESFNKSSSQMKTVALDITDLTPIGTAKHIVAAIDRTRRALKESEINARREELKLDRKRSELAEADGNRAKKLELDILQISSQLEDLRAGQRGAVKKLTFLVEQYESICQEIGVDVITEEMYEADQPVYHVMRAMSQALAAARARGGLIDEGNFIYLQDLGINGAVAQRELTAYLETEQELLNQGHAPSFEMQRNWLLAVAEKFAPEIELYAQARGLKPFVHEALAQPVNPKEVTE